MKYAILLFVWLLAAIPSRADGGSVAEWNVGGTISITNGAVTESIVFDVQYILTSYSPFNVGATEVGQPYEMSTGPLGDFSTIIVVTSGPTYLGFFNAASDEIDLQFTPQFSTDLSGPVGAYVWRCNSQVCSDNVSIEGLKVGIFYPGTFDVTVTSIPVVEPSEIGMLFAGILLVLGLARFRSALALS